MEGLLSRQSEIINAIERICINFSKDGPGRKNEEYVQKRLSALDSLWGEFEQNNTTLVAFDDVSSDYFTKNVYDRMLEYFTKERKVISNCLILPDANKNATGENKPRFEVPVSLVEDRHSIPSRSVVELRSQQETNFRAFSRITKRIDLDNLTEKWEIEDHLKDFQHRWRVIEELHLRIDNLLQGQDEQYDQEFDAFEEKYSSIRKHLNRKLCSTTHLQQSTPKVEIPVFSGRYAQWPAFFDLFNETIHNNNGLSKSQKMQHLKGKVRGEAERIIQHLQISSDNYDTAWEILTHRFNNPYALFSNYIETFLNQPVVHKQGSYELKRLHDTTMECIHGIHNLGVDTTTWDPLLVHLIAKKLDIDTYRDYKEARKSPRDLPSIDELMNFLESKFTALEPINKKEKLTSESSGNSPNQHVQRGSHYNRKWQQNYQSAPTFTPKCPICSAVHDLYRCKRFINMSVECKMKTLAKQQICQNCLFKHFDKPCISKRRCRIFSGEHNTIIHDDVMQVQSTASKSSAMQVQPKSPSFPSSLPTSNLNVPRSPSGKQHNVNHVAAEDEEILLTTLSLKVKAADNTFVTLRALLDQGSQISLISENAAQLLGLPRQRFQASVSGIGVSSKQSKGIVAIHCESIYGDYCFTTQALVISRVINNLPNTSFSKRSWPHLQNINLADPEYNISKPIDLLLDASIYSEIIMSGLIKGSLQAPIAQQTKLGWILSGNVKTFNCSVVVNQVDDLTKFWQVEDINQSSTTMTEEEKYYEEFYQATTRRLDSGRYEVALPMKPDYAEKLRTSRSKAIMQFKQLEKKMSKNESLAESYRKFIHEYETLHHMRLANTLTSELTCYLPHHGVLKLDSTTTALRVVFNASSKTSSGYSLNDLMECGPNLQQDLQGLIIKWRTYKYVITADIEKMFRQFLIRECDQRLQTIIWRDSPDELLREYHLTTVTYGTKAAPFLAMRTLKQIAKYNFASHPLAATAIEHCFYTDDLIAGSDSILDARELQKQLIDVLKGAGLNLRKWSSNSSEVIKDLPSNQLNTPFDFKDTESRKTLGLRWNPSPDIFTFQNKIKHEKSQGSHTKRQLLSDISKIYDPLGWLSPITIRAKINIIQGQLHGELSLPTDKYNIRQLYRVLKVFARIFEDYLIIEVRMPLVSNEMYELDQIITVPRMEAGLMQYIVPTFPFIAFNLKRDTAIFLSHTDLQACMHTHMGRLLCTIDKPVYDMKIKHSICDIELITAESVKTSPCASEQSTCAAKWIRLHKQNSWLYSCCRECSVRIFCTTGMELKSVIENGIVTLGQGCTIKGDKYTMYSHNSFLNHVQRQPDVIEIPEVSVLNNVFNTSIPFDDISPIETEPETWNRLKSQIDQLKQNSSQQLNVHDVHHYALIYTMLGGLLLLSGIIIILWRRLRRPVSEQPRQTLSAPPVPLPRSASVTSVLSRISPIPTRVKFEVPVSEVKGEVLV